LQASRPIENPRVKPVVARFGYIPRLARAYPSVSDVSTHTKALLVRSDVTSASLPDLAAALLTLYRKR
jgi:hypothetical protein